METYQVGDKPHNSCQPREREDVLLLNEQLWWNHSPWMNFTYYNLIVTTNSHLHPKVTHPQCTTAPHWECDLLFYWLCLWEPGKRILHQSWWLESLSPCLGCSGARNNSVKKLLCWLLLVLPWGDRESCGGTRCFTGHPIVSSSFYLLVCSLFFFFSYIRPVSQVPQKSIVSWSPATEETSYVMDHPAFASIQNVKA